MSVHEVRLMALSVLLVLVVDIVSTQALTVKPPEYEVSRRPLAFDFERAYKLTEALAVEYPYRVMGSEPSRLAADWVTNEMEGLGLHTYFQDFPALLRGERLTGRNIIGLRAGASDEIILVMAHYDIPFTAVQGAMDDATGVGVLLELARVFAREAPRRAMAFVATDGEEWGMLGARWLAENLPGDGRVVAAISLDYVAIGELVGIELACIGQFRGYTDLWLRNIAAKITREAGLQVFEPDPVTEYIERAILLSFTDQGPLLRVGIPSINLGSVGSETDLEREVYHTPLDTIENLRAASIKRYGGVAERLIRSIDEMDAISVGPVNYLKLSEEAYLPGEVVTLLQAFSFTPLYLAVLLLWRRHGKGLSKIELAYEALSFAVIFIPLLSGLIALYTLVQLGLIVRYQLYPATPKDPILYSPEFVPLAIVGASAAFTAYLLSKARGGLQRVPTHVVPEHSKLVALTVFLALSILALLFNSYGATVFLIFPAFLWIFLKPSPRRYQRILNAALVIAGGATFYLLVAIYAVRIYLTWEMLWYLTLAVAYGMFTPQGTVLSLGVITVAVRFLTGPLVRATQSTNRGSCGGPRKGGQRRDADAPQEWTRVGRSAISIRS